MTEMPVEILLNMSKLSGNEKGLQRATSNEQRVTSNQQRATSNTADGVFSAESIRHFLPYPWHKCPPDKPEAATRIFIHAYNTTVLEPEHRLIS